MPVEFDHSSRDTEQFNQELGLLLDHLRHVEDKAARREFLDKVTYVVELLHKNQVPKNGQTYAKVRNYSLPIAL